MASEARRMTLYPAASPGPFIGKSLNPGIQSVPPKMSSCPRMCPVVQKSTLPLIDVLFFSLSRLWAGIPLAESGRPPRLAILGSSAGGSKPGFCELGGEVAVETEVKIVVSDVAEFRERLELLHPTPVSARHFEDNFVLDYPDAQLRSQSCLLRVRKTQDMESVTFKGPPQPSQLFKSREELETRVGSADIVLAICERIGMKVWFRYQKYREECLIRPAGEEAQEVHLALDATPIGNYVELEGSETGIRMVAALLGFKESQFLRDSYYSLFLQFCRRRGNEPGHMVFPAKDGQ